jgi:mannosyltransferase OCH1-like enzyme
MILKLLHFVWLGSKLPEDEIKNISSWERYNPDLKIRIWTEKDIPELGFSEGAMKAFTSGDRIYSYQSDIMRAYIINKYGGFYSDTDIECYRKLPDDFFQKDYVFLKPHPKANWLNCAFFGACTDSSIMKNMVSGIVEKGKEEVNRRRGYIYGPQYFTKIINNHAKSGRHDLVIDLGKRIKNTLILSPDFWNRHNPDKYCRHYAKASWRKDRPK